MYSDKDFQTFWFRYKAEGEPHGIIPVEIEGAPTDEETDDVEVPPQPASKPKAKKSKGGLDYGGMKDLVSRLEGLC